MKPGLVTESIRKLLLITGGLIVFSGSVDAQIRLKVGFLDFPPFAVVEGSRVSGVLVDRITVALEQAGFEHELHGYPPVRLFSSFNRGIIDMLIGTKGPEQPYRAYALYSSSPILQMKMRVYTRKDLDIPDDVSDLKGLIGLIRGYRYGGVIDPDNSETHAIASHESAFRMLANGRLNYVIDYAYPAETAIRENKIQNLKSKTIYKVDLFFCLRKDFPDAADVMKRIEAVYQ